MDYTFLTCVHLLLLFLAPLWPKKDMGIGKETDFPEGPVLVPCHGQQLQPLGQSAILRLPKTLPRAS